MAQQEPKEIVPSEFKKLHPIKALALKQGREFKHLVKRQSKTLDEAIQEYQRRYRREPPPGFEKWFQYAQDRGSVIIDDFDMITEAMEPFWKLKPHEVRALVEEGQEAGYMWNISIKGGQWNYSDHWMNKEIAEALADVGKDIPDFELLGNALDEPRVIMEDGAHLDEVQFTDMSQKPTWSAATAPCAGSTGSNAKRMTDKIDLHGLPFVTSMDMEKDLCQHAEYETTHGMFMAPATFIYTKQPVPILSQAKPSTFGDILYPSMWYWDHEDHDLESHDPVWSEKRNRFYWAGSSTGGWQGPDSEPLGLQHRQRFIQLAKHLTPQTAKFLTQSKAGVWETYESQEILSELWDAKFTSIVQCDEKTCEDQNRYFRVTGHEEFSQAFQSRFLMDIDGNSFSGRFYNFLASHSAVLKQTIFREWHDERLVPWVHYVPVSLSMQELPETLRYLALTEDGSKIAQKIAENGREWNAKMLRKEDAAIYLYRLFLEFARVVDDQRVDEIIASPP